MATVGPLSGDEALWQRVADGDPEAFGELFDRHAAVVHSYLSPRLRDRSEAEDLTSAVFLQAWRRRAEVGLRAGVRAALAARGGQRPAP